MKKIILIIILALCFNTSARDATFIWDANPVTDAVTYYRIERLDPTTNLWVEIGIAAPVSPSNVVPLTLRIVDFPDAATKVRAFAGTVSDESLPSEELLVPSRPGKPNGLKWSMTIKIKVG